MGDVGVFQPRRAEDRVSELGPDSACEARGSATLLLGARRTVKVRRT